MDNLHIHQGKVFKLHVKDNVNNKKLEYFCRKNNINYLSSDICSGFAKNNNIATSSINKMFYVDSDDYYLFINPDILIEYKKINQLSSILEKFNYDLFTIDLFKDEKMSIRDPFVRNFPNLLDFFTSYFFHFNHSIIDRSNINVHKSIDWCAGSFLGIKRYVFESLGGFDEKFFMYCEDIDLCFRAREKGYKLFYIPEVKAVHFCQSDNRKLFSKNFIYHVKSIIYMYYKKFIG